jgi:hypothetical protein
VVIGQFVSGVIDSWIVGGFILEGIFFLATILLALSVSLVRYSRPSLNSAPYYSAANPTTQFEPIAQFAHRRK